MKSEELAKLSVEELNKNKAKFKGILIAAGIVWLFLLAAVAYLAFIKGKSAIVFLPIIFAVPTMLLPIFTNLGQVSTELKSRSLS